MTYASRARARVTLIPRNNWDFGVGELAISLAAALRPAVPPTASLEAALGTPPLFTSSGRASLFAILKGLGIPGGSGVGVPLFCCPVVFDAVLQAGMRPVFLDVDPHHFTLSPRDLEEKKGRLAAVVAVHMFGHPPDMDAIRSAAPGLPLIEDCAQGLFSRYKGRRAGELGDVSFFSFRSGKYLSAGEGSAILCRDPRDRERIAAVVSGFEGHGRPGEVLHSLAVFAKSTLYHSPWYGLVGFPLGRRLDRALNLSGKGGFVARRIRRGDLAVAERKMAEFPALLKRQRQNALHLLDGLRLPGVALPIPAEGCESNFFQFALRFASTEERDRFSRRLFEDGIDSAPYLNDIVTAGRSHYGYQGDCPVAEKCSTTVLLIPAHYSLGPRALERVLRSANRAPREGHGRAEMGER